MKVDLESLAAEAKRYQVDQKRTRYPIDFKKSAVAALSHHRYRELVQKLGVGLSTLQKWKRSYGIQAKVKPTQPRTPDSFTFAPIVARQEHIPLRKDEPPRTDNITLEFTDPHARSFRITMPCNDLTANKLFKLFEQNFAAGGH